MIFQEKVVEYFMLQIPWTSFCLLVIFLYKYNMSTSFYIFQISYSSYATQLCVLHSYRYHGDVFIFLYIGCSTDRILTLKLLMFLQNGCL